MTDGAGRMSWTGKRVAVIDVATGEIRELTGEEAASVEPSWSADGSRIAYVSQPDKGDVPGWGGEFAGVLADRRIWVMNGDGSEKRQLTDDPQYRDERPLWSKDGSQILFARLDGERRASLWLVPAVGGEPRYVVEVHGSEGSGVRQYYGSISWDGMFDWWRGP
jgi:Tol biopolymer transport system component